MRKLVRMGLVCLILIIVVLVGYTSWDNNRITIVNQDILLDKLPEGLEGFTILQVTDLHEKEFGDNQRKLIDLINSIDYDAIVFTGDMLNSPSSTNYTPFYSLVDGIRNKDNALFVPGNADPPNYLLNKDLQYEKNDFVKGMEERGVKLLETIHTVNKDHSILHFVEFELSIKNSLEEIEMINSASKNKRESHNHNLYFDHQKKLMEEMKILDDKMASDIVIALNHYPVPDQRIDQLKTKPQFILRDFDLIMAGHYHGGQIRLPFLGAVFVPEPLYQRNGFFPPRDRVKGLWEYNKTKQYVSTGLGSSDAIPFMKFRLFNPPEINLLTLKRI